LACRVLYRKRAERDLDKLARGVTLEWFDGLCDAVESLARCPERCAFVAEPSLRRKGMRQLLYGKGHGVYRVLYRVKEENVEILAIRHASRKHVSRMTSDYMAGLPPRHVAQGSNCNPAVFPFLIRENYWLVDK